MQAADKIAIVDLAFKMIAGGFAFYGFLIGFQRYQQAQNWKRAEVILKLIDAFRGDPKIQNACLMLDWDRRDIQIDKTTQFLFYNESLLSGLRVIWLDENKQIPMDALLVSGSIRLNVDSQVPTGTGFSTEDVFIRDCFDAFFDYFDKVNAFRHSALVEWADLDYFIYWIELVREVGRLKNDQRIQDVMNTYLQVYDFKGFQQLSRECPRPLSPIFSAQQDAGKELR